jgi:hypothetical protein
MVLVELIRNAAVFGAVVLIVGSSLFVVFELIAGHIKRRYAQRVAAPNERIVAALRRHVYREHQLRPWAALEIYESTGEDLALVLEVCDKFAANCRHETSSRRDYYRPEMSREETDEDA